MRAELVEQFGQRRRERAERADQRGVAEHPILQAHSRAARSAARARSIRRGKSTASDAAACRGSGVAELALVAEVDDVLDVGAGSFSTSPSTASTSMRSKSP